MSNYQPELPGFDPLEAATAAFALEVSARDRQRNQELGYLAVINGLQSQITDEYMTARIEPEQAIWDGMIEFLRNKPATSLEVRAAHHGRSGPSLFYVDRSWQFYKYDAASSDMEIDTTIALRTLLQYEVDEYSNLKEDELLTAAGVLYQYYHVPKVARLDVTKLSSVGDSMHLLGVPVVTNVPTRQERKAGAKTTRVIERAPLERIFEIAIHNNPDTQLLAGKIVIGLRSRTDAAPSQTKTYAQLQNLGRPGLDFEKTHEVLNPKISESMLDEIGYAVYDAQPVSWHNRLSELGRQAERLRKDSSEYSNLQVEIAALLNQARQEGLVAAANDYIRSKLTFDLNHPYIELSKVVKAAMQSVQVPRQQI